MRKPHNVLILEKRKRIAKVMNEIVSKEKMFVPQKNLWRVEHH